MEPIQIRNPFAGAAGFHLLETNSTMDEARRLAKMGFPAGTTVAADIQSAGRGRFPDRSWESEPGANLLATLFLGPEAAAVPGVPIRIGLALCRAIDLFALQSGSCPSGSPMLKWPNDIMMNDRKIAGVLCEAAADGTFIGFGINVNQRRFGAELASKATSIALELDKADGKTRYDRFRLLELALDQIALTLCETAWREEAEALLWRRGERVRFQEGLPESGQLREGRLAGIEANGALLLALDGERHARAFVAGELLFPNAARVDRSGSHHIR
jgi:BirA family biotin operon repressor/biotin-[acetyl-CoA-carboxylase] ligase